MSGLIIFIGIAAFFLIALSLWNRSQRSKNSEEPKQCNKPAPIESGCCGNHETCERNKAGTHRDEEAEYFDDEELDRFRDRKPTDYSAPEAGEFREVFNSLLDKEKFRWLQSLKKRNIAIPVQLEYEVSTAAGNLQDHKEARRSI